MGSVIRARNEIVHPRDSPSGDAVFVGLEHIQSNTGRRTGQLQIRLQELTGRKARFYPGDIVYGYLRPYLNKVWLADFAGFCSVDQYVFQVDVAAAYPGYVAHFMRSPAYLSAAPIHVTPGQLPRIRTDEVLSVKLPLPPLPVQVQIAESLDRLLIAAFHAKSASLEQKSLSTGLRSEVVESAFRDLEATRVRLESIVRAPGDITDGPFGSNLKGDHYESSGVRVIRLGNIGLGRFIDADRAFVTPAHAAQLQRHRAEAGDVVIAALGDGARPAGRACLVPTDLGQAIVKADCFRVRTAHSGLDAAFFVHVMNSPQIREVIETKTRGATRPRMTLGMLKELEVPVPSIADQKRLVVEVDEQLAAIDAMDASIRAEQVVMEALPAALLRRAFEGLAA